MSFQTVMNTFGAAIMLPIIIFIFELVLRVKPSKAVRSAIYIGVGLNGLVSILNPYFMSLMGKAVSEMVTAKGIQLPYVDTGWALLASLGYSTTVGAIIIPVGILVNVVLLLSKLTDTLDLDLWNFWHWAFIGTMVDFATGSLLLGIISAIAVEIFLLFLADITAKPMQKFFKLPGISFPHASLQGGTIVALLTRVPLEKLGIMKLKVNSSSIRKRFGVMGDSVVIGFIVAVIIGFLAWGDQLDQLSSWASILTDGIGTGAFIYLYPKATASLLEGFSVLEERVRDIMTNRKATREIYFGMDGALTIGNPDTITVGLVSMIIAVGLVFFLPGNHFLMLADLGVTPFFLAGGIVAIMGGNFIASLITDTVALVITLYASSAMAPMFAANVSKVGLQLPDTGSAMVGADIRPIHALFYYVGQNPIVLGAMIVLTLVGMFFIHRNPNFKDKITGFKNS